MSSLPRSLLLPFSWLYGAGVFLRNKQYDWKFRKSVSFELPVIGVGNLSAGGTGKTPHVEYLLRLLKESFHAGILSRGYGRKTSGYLLVEESSTANEAGDEPLQIKRNFPNVTVAVCEERAIGIPIMLLDDPQLQVIILDDSFQHRQVQPTLSILLTEFSKPYSGDMLLPAGRLREPRSAAARADVIVVTKCPENISLEQRIQLTKELAANPDQKVFFSFLKYGDPFSFFGPENKLIPGKNDVVFLFCGIANPDPLQEYLGRKVKEVKSVKFSDHHRYSLADVKKIQTAFLQIKEERKFLVTTEKDAVRLLPFKDYLLSQQLEIYCVPVKVKFSEIDRDQFNSLVMSCIQQTISSQ